MTFEHDLVLGWGETVAWDYAFAEWAIGGGEAALEDEERPAGVGSAGVQRRGKEERYVGPRAKAATRGVLKKGLPRLSVSE